MQTPRFRRLAVYLGALIVLVTTPGCYSYTYRLRSPAGSDNQEIAIENYPHEDVRWSSWWGGHEDKWSPVHEVTDISGKRVQVPYCDYGLGQVTVQYTGWTFLVTVFTLGFTAPVSVSAWCSTEVSPRAAPAPAGGGQPSPQPSGPGSHVGP